MLYIQRLSIAIILMAVATATLVAQSPGTGSRGGTAIDPRVIIHRADSASLTLHSARFSARYSFKGAGKSDSDMVSGDVIVVEDPQESMIGIKTRISVDNGLIYTYRNNSLQVVEPKPKELLTVDSAEGAVYFISGSMNGSLATDFHLSNDSPFANTLTKALKLEYLGTTEINGVRCFSVKGYFPDNKFAKAMTRTWFIGADDYFVRGVFIAYLFNDALQTQNYSVANLETNVNVPEETFARNTPPEGYKVRAFHREKDPELLAVGSQAPDWTLKDVNGKPVTLSKLRGKTVFLDFWYSTCGPCSAALPSIQKLHERFKDRGVAVLGVNVGESAELVSGVMKRRGLNYQSLINGDSVATHYNVSGYPTFYLIGADGKIVHRGAGFADESERELADIIDKYLKERGR